MRSAGIERLDDPGEVRERAGQAVHLVDNDQIDLPLPDVGQQILQGGAATAGPPFPIGRSFMLDAQPAANAPACPPAVQPIPASPANADTTGVRSKPAALLAAATALLPDLEAGRALDVKTLREAMSAAFGAGDTHGAWVWRDAYEAAEAAMVLFIQRYGRLMHREAGAGPRDRPPPCLAMLETLAALEPYQTRRSEEQLALQQFSTPLPLAYAALQAAAIRPGDIVLEPSAGTGDPPRNRSRFHQCPGRSDRRTGIRPHRRRVACSHHRQCAATASGRANSRCACSGRRSVRPCRHTAGPTKAHSGHRAQHQTRSPASPRLGPGSRTRLRDPARRRARHGKRTGGNPYRGLRALAPPDRAHSRRLRTSDTAGAIRRHGGGAHKIDRRKLVPYVRRSREAGMSLSWLREMGP